MTEPAPDPRAPEKSRPEHGDNDPEAMRLELERLRKREQQIMELIDCKHPDRLLHDLRNVLNELQLLRMVSDLDKT